MIIRESIKLALQDGIKTNKELQVSIPDKSTRIISATISNNPSIFLRLDKALIGLVGRDEDKVTNNRISSNEFCLYKRMVNLLQSGEKSYEEIFEILHDEKKVSIRATVNMRPDLFIRVARGVIGRKGRDEHLIKKYEIRKRSTRITRMKNKWISEYIEELLEHGAIHLQEICLRVPFPKKSITAKLSKNPKFERIGGGWWRLSRRRIC